jgi:hypothetical protein
MKKREKRETTEAREESDTPLTLPTCQATKVKARALSWVVPRWLPGACLAIIEGRKGAGKSSVLCALAAHVAGGRGFFGADPPEARPVLWGSGEENVERETKPKLRAAGAPLRLVRFLGRDDRGQEVELPQLPGDLAGVEGTIRAEGAGLLVLDPLRSFLNAALQASDEVACGHAAGELNRIAGRTGCLIVLSRHLVKGRHASALDAGLGSSAWGNVARALLRCDEEPHGDWDRVLWPVAVNGVSPGPGRCYSMVAAGRTQRVEWGDELPRGEVVAADEAEDPGHRTEGNAADECVRRVLAKGEQLASDVQAAAARERISPSQVWRAAARLGVQRRRQGWGPGSCVYWSL